MDKPCEKCGEPSAVKAILKRRVAELEAQVKDLERSRAFWKAEWEKELQRISWNDKATAEKVLPYLDALQRYSDGWYVLALDSNMASTTAACHAKHMQDAINGIRRIIRGNR